MAHENVSAAAWPVTAGPYGVASAKSVKNAGPVQEVVHQRVDDNEAGTDVKPARPLRPAPISNPAMAIAMTLSEIP